MRLGWVFFLVVGCTSSGESGRASLDAGADDVREGDGAVRADSTAATASGGARPQSAVPRGGLNGGGSGGTAGGDAARPSSENGGAGLGGPLGSGGQSSGPLVPSDAGSPEPGATPGGAGVRVVGDELLVDGQSFVIRGVAWNPVGPGQTHPAGLDPAGYAAIDIPLMQAASINCVRTYEPLLDEGVLDQLHDAGIFVLNSVYPYGGDDVSVVSNRVNQVAHHPAILFWLLGNEWNYNGLYVGLSHDEAMARLNEAADLVRAADPSRPIATVYGELPSRDVIEAMPRIDLWGINAYRGISFGSLFSDWAERSGKPMFLSEYGADAYNADLGAVDLESQALAVRELTREIEEATRSRGPAVGGTVFEWADEWWKDAEGSPDVQDVGGIAPGGGPYPDATFNEEWWGIVDIERMPRPAYDALAEIFAGG